MIERKFNYRIKRICIMQLAFRQEKIPSKPKTSPQLFNS